MFANVASAPAKKAKKAAEKDTVTIEGLEDLAVVQTTIKNLEAIKAALELTVKDQMREHFIDEGKRLRKRPDNFIGEDGGATASCEMRKRGDNSPLKDDEVAKIEALGLTTVEREIVPERFVINPDYADDMKVLNAVSKALQGAKGVPKNLFLKQEAEVKVCVDETALDEIFRKKPEVIARHFDSIVTLAIKPKLTSQSDVSDVFDAARKIVTGSRAPTKNKKALTKKKVW